MKNFTLAPIIILSFNIIIHSQEKYTAAYFHEKADSIANQNFNRPRLLEIESDDVDISGKSEYWIFTYDSIRIQIHKDSIRYNIDEYWLAGFSVMDSDWFDSDFALCIAEREGGEAFRQKYPECKISADLGKASASPFTEWLIKYDVEETYNEYFLICIDALTGDITSIRNAAVNQNKSMMEFMVCQNYPNPFNVVTTFSYSLETPSFVRLEIFDIMGRKVETLVDAFFAEGDYRMHWDARDYPSGIYFYYFSYGLHTIKRKLLIVK